MEHRCCQRTPLQVNVLIHHHKLGSLRGKSLDISIEGMRIGGIGKALPRNAICKLHVEIDQEIIEIDALVVHSDKQGTGVFFSRPLMSWMLIKGQNPSLAGQISLPFPGV